MIFVLNLLKLIGKFNLFELIADFPLNVVVISKGWIAVEIVLTCSHSPVSGFIGLNNIVCNDYANVILQTLAHVPPIRAFFLLTDLTEKSELGAFRVRGVADAIVRRFGLLIRKIWSSKAFKGHVSPHEVLQETTNASKRKFTMRKRSDASEFLTWFVNTLHRDLSGGGGSTAAKSTRNPINPCSLRNVQVWWSGRFVDKSRWSRRCWVDSMRRRKLEKFHLMFMLPKRVQRSRSQVRKWFRSTIWLWICLRCRCLWTNLSAMWFHRWQWKRCWKSSMVCRRRFWSFWCDWVILIKFMKLIVNWIDCELRGFIALSDYYTKLSPSSFIESTTIMFVLINQTTSLFNWM